MIKRDGYIPGVPCWVDTTQPDPATAAAFYGALFGWELEDDHAAVLADPAGAVFRAWQAKAHKGAAIVDEPGSLNFNVLNTADPAGARSFYGAVFGWQTLDLGGGELWTLSGYCDFLERRDPGLRERMAALGAPAGFEDVVASLAPLADGRPGAQPHWGVTFAVEDADATAARAGELGARIVVAPFDAPWVRMAVIAAPQGAVFTVTSTCRPTAASRRRRAPRAVAPNRPRLEPRRPRVDAAAGIVASASTWIVSARAPDR